jgi:hypothetical protein
VTGAAFPALIPTVSLVVLLSRRVSDPAVITLEISIRHNSLMIFEAPMKVDFNRQLRVRAIANLQGIPLAGAGSLEFRVGRSKRELGRWSVQVKALAVPSLERQVPMAVSANAVSAITPPKTATKKKAAKKKAAKKRR